jgi:hypothetical protein
VVLPHLRAASATIAGDGTPNKKLEKTETPPETAPFLQQGSAAAMYNPVAASGVGAPMPPRLSERTRQLASRVAEAKGQRLTCSEFFCSKFLGALGTLPFCGLTGFTTVAANTTLWFVRRSSLCFPRCSLHDAAPAAGRCARWARDRSGIL